MSNVCQLPVLVVLIGHRRRLLKQGGYMLLGAVMSALLNNSVILSICQQNSTRVEADQHLGAAQSVQRLCSRAARSSAIRTVAQSTLSGTLCDAFVCEEGMLR